MSVAELSWLCWNNQSLDDTICLSISFGCWIITVVAIVCGTYVAISQGLLIFLQVSAKTSMGYRDTRSGKLVTGFPWNIYKSGESTAGNTWCPLRYGEFITFEFKRSYLINKLIITLHRVNEKGKMHEKFSAKVLDYFVQFSTERDSWTNVRYKVWMSQK